MKFKLDCGIDITIISKRNYNQLLQNIVQLQKPDRKFGPVKQLLHTIGMFNAKLQFGQHTIHSTAFVVDGLDGCLLRRNECIQLHLISRCNQVNSLYTTVKPLQEFPELFKGLGHFTI